MTREELLRSACEQLDEKAARALEPLALPAAVIALAPSDDAAIPVGVSKYGGAADVPASFRWPVRASPDDPGASYPLTFLCQFCFADLRPSLEGDALWPDDGVLAVFYDGALAPGGHKPQDWDALRLYYFSNSAVLVRTRPPPGVAPDSAEEPKFVLPAHRIFTGPRWTLPSNSDAVLAALDPARPAYYLYDAWWKKFVRTKRHHRFGGHPAPAQDDPVEDCRGRAEASPEMKARAKGPWRLLFQFDYDDRPDLACNYGGMQFFVCASERAIRDRSFDAAWWSEDMD